VLGGKLAGMSGSHRPTACSCCAARRCTPGRVDGAQIADMAPTVLRSATSPRRPTGMAACSTRWAAAADAGGAGGLVAGGVDYGAAETADLQRRLEQLGYLA
jgi:hypothetical protein